MADDDRVRVEVGFEGGQIVGGFVDVASADSWNGRLHEDGPRAVVLDIEDGPLPRRRARVVYFRRFDRASRVGFGRR